MSNETDPNAGAFAANSIVSEDVYMEQAGLTKREYFAAAALQGILASSGQTYSIKSMAESSVEMADALIEELNKRKS